MKRKFTMIILAAMTLICVGCSNQNNKTLNLALESLKEPLRLMDQRYVFYSGALEAVQEYVEEPTQDLLNSAKNTCAKAINQISELPIFQSDLSPQNEEDMAKIGISVEDYYAPIEYETYYRQEYIQNLENISEYLDKAPTQDEDLKQILQVFIDVNDIYRKVDYLCINELFCQFTGKEIDSFSDEFLASLSGLGADGLPWETDSAVLEAKANKLMNDADQSLMFYAEYLGQHYND